MAQRFFSPAPQFFYSGTPAAPLSGGLMYFYEPGTTTPKDTYSDNGLTTPNTNPVVLTSSGVLPNVFLDGPYKVNLTDKNGVQQPGWPRDSVNSAVDLAFAAWDATITYGEGATNIVYGSDGNYYISIQANNTSHDPTDQPSLWWALWPFPSLAKGTVYVGNGTEVAALAVGTNGQAILADSGQPTGLRWADVAVTAATQAQMEAATSNTTVATPLNTNWHPGVSKCWIYANGTGTSILASHNVTSITDVGTGVLGVTVATDFSSANYPVVPGINGSTNLGISNSSAAGSFELRSYDVGTLLGADPNAYVACCFGDQA